MEVLGGELLGAPSPPDDLGFPMVQAGSISGGK